MRPAATQAGPQAQGDDEMTTYPIDVPVVSTELGKCVLRILSPLEAVLVDTEADGTVYGPSDILPTTHCQAACGYIHKLPGREYSAAEQSAIDEYVIATAVEDEINPNPLSIARVPLGQWRHRSFKGGATINTMDQLAEINRRLGRQLVRNV